MKILDCYRMNGIVQHKGLVKSIVWRLVALLIGRSPIRPVVRDSRQPMPARKRSRRGRLNVNGTRTGVGALPLVEMPSLTTRLSKLILLSLAVSGIVLLLGALVWGYQHRSELIASVPVKQVIIRAPLLNLPSSEIEAWVAPFVATGFFSVNLSSLEAVLEQQPWVSHAVVSRHWPATIQVKVFERKPIAYWGKDRLIDQNGELFKPQVGLDNELLQAELPKLDAPDGYSHWVMQQYDAMNNLFQQINVKIDQLSLGSQMSWYLKLSNGVSLRVDRNNTMQKLSQLVAAYPRLNQLDRSIEQIDLRYLNGFSVKWREDEETIKG